MCAYCRAKGEAGLMVTGGIGPNAEGTQQRLIPHLYY